MDPRKRIRKSSSEAVKGRWLVNIGDIGELGLKDLSKGYNEATGLNMEGGALGFSSTGDFFEKYEKESDHDKKADN